MSEFTRKLILSILIVTVPIWMLPYSFYLLFVDNGNSDIF